VTETADGVRTEPASPTEPVPYPTGAARPNPGGGPMRVNELGPSLPNPFRTVAENTLAGLQPVVPQMPALDPGYWFNGS
jgi:hypothetical protein